ncbi:DUF2922 domain-containing protein [Sporosarcina sp. PTS2304]|uniref:DUF2922 domain-containing protein n=1 Tax=Sporosarcina sp. PTS2304 TaxID=2283194 RepID=UPI000E0D1665|nr:DUF2922 domain-containing protein [Sporosarcina sp. PTS2304]AXH99156.1 DUF2922 domain-containing protein [Sporosarcina sp. PTS2304]
MAKVLELTFLTAANESVKLTVDEPRIDLTAAGVESVMQQVIASGVFIIEESPLESIKSARIVERDTQTLISR